MSAAYSVKRNENPRYMLRSMSQENNKRPLLVYSYEKYVLASEKRVTSRKLDKTQLDFKDEREKREKLHANLDVKAMSGKLPGAFKYQLAFN
ncbi:unnamed protein product [Dovyalis caffra]|uniref:Uncharacterized protein n=1 Tax=Dovyalis caffra TaxID=77055 RepID=A0AAV1SSW0_9ROSI|nr:unnamed protein product [Dovyalis caffra]